MAVFPSQLLASFSHFPGAAPDGGGADGALGLEGPVLRPRLLLDGVQGPVLRAEVDAA